MKRVFILLVSLVFGIAIGIPAAGAGGLCGTWVNPEYSKTAAKVIFHPDGTFEALPMIESAEAMERGTCKIVEKWTDPDGCACFKAVFWSEKNERAFWLMKISESGETFEYIQKLEGFPASMDQGADSYRKYTRK